MRLKIVLNTGNTGIIIPYNYQYYLQSLIYSTLRSIDPEYSDFLHEQGYSSETDNRKYKMFVFSDLMLGSRKAERNGLRVFSDKIEWNISSPMPDFLNTLVNGLFVDNNIRIANVQLSKSTIETLPEPEFKSEMTFTCLSPINASTVIEQNGKRGIYYLRPEDAELSDNIRSNLINKYRRIYNKKPDNDDLTFSFDMEYIRRKKGRISRLVTIKEGAKDETKIKGFVAPFKVTGNPELIKVGYEAGFGARNSLGFGLAGVVDHERH